MANWNQVCKRIEDELSFIESVRLIWASQRLTVFRNDTTDALSSAGDL